MEKFTNMILFTVILLTWMFHGETLGKLIRLPTSTDWHEMYVKLAVDQRRP